MRESENYLLFYIDDSEINERIDASTMRTIILTDLSFSYSQIMKAKIRKTYLDSMLSFIVYSEKLYDILMIIQMIAIDYVRSNQFADWHEYEKDYRSIVIFTNNQTTIRIINNFKSQFEQYILHQIIHELNLRVERRIEIHWISTHIDVKSNEMIDKLAKKIIDWSEDDSNTVASTSRDLKTFVFAQLCHLRAKTLVKWSEDWIASIIDRAIRRLKSLLNSHILDKFVNLDKARNFMLVQTRTQNISLNNYLVRMKIVNFKNCSCDLKSKNVNHVLLHCLRYANLKEKTLWADDLRISDLIELLENLDRVTMITRFLSQTRRFFQFKQHEIRADYIDANSK